MARVLPDQILTALDTQTVVIPGTGAFTRVIAGVAAALRQARNDRDALATELEQRLAAHPLAEVLSSMPGIGLRTALTILAVIGDASAFPSAAALAAYTGLAQVTRRSGTSIKGHTRARGGHQILKKALFLSAFASLADPVSRAYYDRKRAEHETHTSALICLARRRLDVFYAMLRDGQPYQPPTPTAG
jgi:transposase